MFYKLIRLLVAALAILSLCLVLGLALGYMGPAKAPVTFQLLIIFTSLFLFYQSRPSTSKNSIHKILNLIVHVLVIPLGVAGALCVTGQWLATSYWFWINLLFVIFLALVLINIIAASGIKNGIKFLVIGAAVIFSALVLMQMSGKFNHGKIILYSALAFTLMTIAAVIASPGKKSKSQL
jgi:hypothetical protein